MRLKAIINFLCTLMVILILTYLEYNLSLSKAFSYIYNTETKNARYAKKRDNPKVSVLKQSSAEAVLDTESMRQRICHPFSSHINLLNSTVQNKTRNNYRVVDPPLNSGVSKACSGMFDRRRVLWITGPPGSGKTTLAKRFQEYGFMAMDCEDPWAGSGNRTRNLIRASQFVLENGTTTYIFAACFVKILWSKPVNVDVAVLFPNSKVYRRRWMARNPDDLQKPNKQWQLTSNLVKTFERDTSVHVIYQSSSAECADLTLFNICRKVLGSED